jgi:DNA-binding NtrC family response regulator
LDQIATFGPTAAPVLISGESDTGIKNLDREISLLHLEGRNWKIYGPRGAAQSLKIKPMTLVFKMKKMGLRKPEA